jgi:hypothetical protein
MNKRGRPMDPAGQVERLAGDEEAKRRLTLVLSTLTGGRTIEDVCTELGIGESRFFELKHAALSSALSALTPEPAGRPAQPDGTPLTREQELEAKISALEEELACALVRTEMALAMPRLLKKPAEKKSKPKRKQRRMRRGARRGPRAALAPPREPSNDDAGLAR